MSTRIWTVWPTAAVLLLAGILTQAEAAPPDASAAAKAPVQVILEMRFLTVAGSCFERLGLGCDIDCKVNVQETQTGSRLLGQCSSSIAGLGGCTVPNQTGCLPSPCQPRLVTQQLQGCTHECCPKSCGTGLTPAAAPASDATRVTVLTTCQAARLLETAQGDPRTNVLCAPKLMTLDGQEASLDVTQEQHFVTSVEVFWNGDMVVPLPKSVPYTLGLRMSAQPQVAVDQTSVHLHLKANWTSLVTDPAPLSPVTSMLTPVFENGTCGAPVPFTQFIQTPRLAQLAVDKTLCIPDGGTVLLSGWTRRREPCCEENLCILSQIPILNCLFKNGRTEPEAEHVLLLITSRVTNRNGAEPCSTSPSCPHVSVTQRQPLLPVPIAAPGVHVSSWQAQERVRVRQGEAEEQEPLRGKELTSNGSTTLVQGKDKKVAKLLAKYQHACAEGRLADAQKLAGRALLLDPACFRKSPDSKE